MKRSSPKCCSFMVCLTVVLREIVTIVAITCTSRLSHPTSSYDDKRVGYNISPEEVWDARKGFRYVWDLYKGRHLYISPGGRYRNNQCPNIYKFFLYIRFQYADELFLLLYIP